MFSRSSQFCHVISCIVLLTIIQVEGDGGREWVYCDCQSGNSQQSPCQHRYIPCSNYWPHSRSIEDQPRYLIRKKHKPTSYCCQYPYHSSKCPLSSSTLNTRRQTLMWDGCDFVSAPINYHNYCPYCNLPKTCKYSDNYFTGYDGGLYCMKQICNSCKRFCRNCPNYLGTDSDRYRNAKNNFAHNQYWCPVYSPNTMLRMCCCNDGDQHVLSNSNKCTSGHNNCRDHADRNCNCDFSHYGWKMVQMPVQYSPCTTKSGDYYGYSSD